MHLADGIKMCCHDNSFFIFTLPLLLAGMTFASLLRSYPEPRSAERRSRRAWRC